MTVSSPPLPWTMSPSRLPVAQSLPSPPLSLSSPLSPQRVSLPPPPLIVSSPDEPTMTSSPGVPLIVPAPRIVGSLPLHVGGGGLHGLPLKSATDSPTTRTS